MKPIRKAVIPVAGLGTRFLPATKAQPKEMLTLVDKPIIQYIVEEAVASGIEQIIFVTSQTKWAIENHFDRNFELEYRLKQKDKHDALVEITKISDLADFVYIRQKTPKGLGDAILTAAPLIDDEPFAVFLGDDIVDGPKPAMQQLIEVYNKYEDVVLGTIQVPDEKVSRYGIIKAQELEKNQYQVSDLVEKPSLENAPSRMAIMGRYILRPQVLDILRTTGPGKGNEIQLTDALVELAQSKPIYAAKIQGEYFDCGSKLDFLKATVHFGLQHKNISSDFKKYLHTVE